MFSTRNRLSSLLHFKNAIPFELESLASGVSLLCSFCNDTYFDEIELYINVRSGEHLSLSALNPLSTNPPKWSNTLKKFAGCCLTEKTNSTFLCCKTEPYLIFWREKHLLVCVCAFLKQKTYMLIPIWLMRANRWWKIFHSADFRKQDYFFWPKVHIQISHMKSHIKTTQNNITPLHDTKQHLCATVSNILLFDNFCWCNELKFDWNGSRR